MNHPENQIQRACVSWFRLEYPECSRLLFHVKNEETGGRVSGAIYKGSGVVPGVPDLMLSIPSCMDSHTYNSLGLEMKAGKNKQNANQIIFQQFFEASGSCYRVVYSFDDFVVIVSNWMKFVQPITLKLIFAAYKNTENAQYEAEKIKFHKFLTHKKI